MTSSRVSSTRPGRVLCKPIDLFFDTAVNQYRCFGAFRFDVIENPVPVFHRKRRPLDLHALPSALRMAAARRLAKWAETSSLDTAGRGSLKAS